MCRLFRPGDGGPWFIMKFVMGKTVLITGANSLLGTHTICELLSAGYAVRGLLRCLGSYVGVEDPALELVEGEFTDRETLRRAMHGCDYVVHCAAKTGQSGSYDSYEQVNVTATERLVELASECGVKRVVNVASANVFAYGTKGQPGDETRSMAAPFTESAYARSKFEALQRLEHFRNQVEIVTVCPTFMIGAWDSRPSSGRIILMGYGRRIVFCPPGGKILSRPTMWLGASLLPLRGGIAENDTSLRVRIIPMRSSTVCSLSARGIASISFIFLLGRFALSVQSEICWAKQV